MPLAQLAALFEHPGARFFSLQKGGPEGELARLASNRVVDLSPHLNDFRDTAAAIERLDLVLTVDTSVAHLAGALGRETWVMITHVPDFRWMLERDDSPWYPSVRLFRQPAPRDWASVITKVRRALDARVAGTGRTATPASHVDEALTMLPSCERRPDGRPRFELAIGLGDLSRAEVFGEYERELLGAGSERALAMFLSEALQNGDVLVDPAPGLGLAALRVATLPSASVTAHVVEPNGLRAERVKRAARDAGAGGRIVVHRQIPNAASLGGVTPALGRAGRIILRIGDVSATPELLGTLAADGALDIAAVVWPSARPTEIASALDTLAAHGFWLGAVSLVRGEVSLDPLADRNAVQTVIAIEAPFLVALGGNRRAGGDGDRRGSRGRTGRTEQLASAQAFHPCPSSRWPPPDRGDWSAGPSAAFWWCWPHDGVDVRIGSVGGARNCDRDLSERDLGVVGRQALGQQHLEPARSQLGARAPK